MARDDLRAMPEDAVSQTRFVPRVRRTTKKSDSRTGVATRRSNSIRSDLYRGRPSQIAGPILITTRLSFDRLFIDDGRRHRSGLRFYGLRASRYLISSVSTIVTGVDPDTPPSTNCDTVSFVRLRAASKLTGRPRQDCGTRYFTLSSREEA